MSSTNKVALITGASRGIGRAITLELARDNFDCIINYVRNQDAADEVKKSVEKSGQRAHLIQPTSANPPTAKNSSMKPSQLSAASISS